MERYWPDLKGEQWSMYKKKDILNIVRKMDSDGLLQHVVDFLFWNKHFSPYIDGDSPEIEMFTSIEMDRLSGFVEYLHDNNLVLFLGDDRVLCPCWTHCGGHSLTIRRIMDIRGFLSDINSSWKGMS